MPDGDPQTSLTVRTFIDAMERIAPPSLAEDWDKVGLHVGGPSSSLTGPVLLTIDLTEAVLAEAIAMNASAVMAYHPPIWKPVDRLTDQTTIGRLLLRAVRHDIAVYSAHTALDAIEGGVTDWLCEGVSGSEEPGQIAGDCRALSPAMFDASASGPAPEPGGRAGGPEVKIITFTPRDSVEQVRNGLATAGAGRIGRYSVCSFSTEGVGTFLGGEGANPVVGEAGRLETVDEVRLEMICPRQALPLALETLRSFHPYEEPAVDVVELAARPRRGIGAGRRLTLDQPASPIKIGERLKRFLPDARVKIAVPEGVPPDDPVARLGVVPGAGEDMLERAQRESCQAFITGEMRHHSVVAALNQGVCVILAGHTNTERGYLHRLAGRLSDELRGHDVRVSERDADPLRVL